MLRITIAVLLLSLGTFLVGCQTMTKDSEQNIQRYNRMADLHRRMINEDIEHILLLDRTSRLTRWHLRAE